MKKEILLLLIFSFFIAGCSSKQPPIVFKQEVVCYKLEKVEIKPLECNEAKEISNDKTQFIVDESDKEVFLSRCNELKSAMTFYENQIDRYNAFCEKQINKNFPRENLKEGEI